MAVGWDRANAVAHLGLLSSWVGCGVVAEKDSPASATEEDTAAATASEPATDGISATGVVSTDTGAATSSDGDGNGDDTDAGDDTGGFTDSGASETAGATTGPADPLCLLEPIDSGAIIDLEDWEPDIDPAVYVGEWAGDCLVSTLDIAATVNTTLDCSADPEGPPVVNLTFVPSASGSLWTAGETVVVQYHRDDWEQSEIISLRTAAGGLLLAIIDDGMNGTPEIGDHIAPLTIDQDLSVCPVGMDQAGDDIPAPMELTVTDPSGTEVSMYQGDTATLMDDTGESLEVAIYRAEIGTSSHEDGRIVMVVHR